MDNSKNGNGKFILIPPQKFTKSESKQLEQDFRKALKTGSGLDSKAIQHVLDNTLLIAIDDSED